MIDYDKDGNLDLVNQLPYLKGKYPKHADYAGKRVTEIFQQEAIIIAKNDDEIQVYEITTR